LVSYHIHPWRWKQHWPPKRWYPTTSFPEDGGSMNLRNFGILPRPSLKMKAALASEMLVSYHIHPWRWRQHGPPKRWYPTTSLPEDGGSMDLRNVGILQQLYTAPQLGTPRFESSPPRKSQTSQTYLIFKTFRSSNGIKPIIRLARFMAWALWLFPK
jgi:hypothetical protein